MNVPRVVEEVLMKKHYKSIQRYKKYKIINDISRYVKKSSNKKEKNLIQQNKEL